MSALEDETEARSGRTEGTGLGASVQIVDLTKLFGDVRAVDSVSLEIRAGEFLALLGPSGSGKTTILNTIAGFEQPTSGEVLINGRPVTQLSPNRRGLGMVFQHYALFPHMSVAENVAFPLKMRRVPVRKRRKHVEEALTLVQLRGLGQRRPAQLSGGQQQRVALARAIVFRPPVLLMDEPLGALDKKLREQMEFELKRLQKQLGVTVIYVTHDQEEALTMADRIAVLHEGRLEQLGTPEELYEWPANAFVADFVGETNFLAGTLQSLNGASCVVVLADGVNVRGSLPPGQQASFRKGDSVRVAVRPENVSMQSVGAEGHGSLIEEALYAGGTIAYTVQLPSGARIIARSAARNERFSPGDRVTVVWETEDARVYGGANE